MRSTLAALSLAAVALQVNVSADDATLGVPGRVSGTPWVAADGAFVAVVWGGTADGKTDVFSAVSRNGGSAFGAPVRVNVVPGEARLGGELPPRVSLRRVGPARDPEVAVLWTARDGATTLKLARSSDGGQTFQAPVTLSSAGAPGDRGWPALTFDTGGGVHAIWLDHRGLAPPPGAANPHTGHGPRPGDDGAALAQKSGLFYASGARPPRERQVAAGVCYCCKTAVAAFGSATVFAAWRHIFPGSRRDMAFSVSRDGGRTFSAPVRVSEDGWEINGCPDDGPAMAVDREGTIHLIWPTVIAGPEPEGAIFYAWSRDGRTFTPRTRLATLGSPRPTHPQIAVDASGRIAAAWEELVDGRRVAVVRQIVPEGNGRAAFGPVVHLSPGEPAAYPVLAAAGSGFVAVWTGGKPGDTAVRVRAFRLP